MRSRFLLTIATTIALAGLLTGCTGKIVTYVDPQRAFSFDYSDSWDLLEGAQGTLPTDASRSVGVFDPHGSGDGDNLTFDYFAVDIYELDKVTAPTAQELKEGFTDYLDRLKDSDDSFWVIDEPSATEVNGRPAIMVAYMYTADGVDVRCAEYRLVDVQGVVYSLHTQSSVANWDANAEMFSTFLNTFTLSETS